MSAHPKTMWRAWMGDVKPVRVLKETACFLTIDVPGSRCQREERVCRDNRRWSFHRTEELAWIKLRDDAVEEAERLESAARNLRNEAQTYQLKIDALEPK